MKKRIISIIFAVIIIVALIGGFAYLRFKMRKDEGKFQEPISAPTETAGKPAYGPENVKPPTSPPPGQQQN